MVQITAWLAFLHREIDTLSRKTAFHSSSRLREDCDDLRKKLWKTNEKRKPRGEKHEEESKDGEFNKGSESASLAPSGTCRRACETAVSNSLYTA